MLRINRILENKARKWAGTLGAPVARPWLFLVPQMPDPLAGAILGPGRICSFQLPWGHEPGFIGLRPFLFLKR